MENANYFWTASFQIFYHFKLIFSLKKVPFKKTSNAEF